MKEITLTQGMVALVDDEDFEWLNQWKWCVNKKTYAKRAIYKNGEIQILLMHRDIMNAQKGMQVDHIDHNCLNNQKSNLRLCNNSQNQMNCNTKGGKSKYKGVVLKIKNRSQTLKNGKIKTYYYSKPFYAQITVNSKKKFLGYFKTEMQAAIAYDEAAVKYFGEFANLNFK